MFLSAKNSSAHLKWSLRLSVTLFVMGAYLIFSRGFMLIRIPPVAGGGIPIGEILLAGWLLFLIKDMRWLPSFTDNIIFIPFLLWWTLGLVRVLLAFPEYGMWAFRDATHMIESFYLWVGFVFAANPGAIDRLFVWLRRVLIVGVLYSFTYPWQASLVDFSPTIMSAAGYTSNIFFVYNTSATLLLWEAMRRFIERAGETLIPALLMAYAIGIFQARTVYLQVLAILLMLLWHQRRAFGRMTLALAGALLVFVIIVESGIEIKGRLGENISLEFMVRHFIAIAGIESEGVVGAARGVGQRLGWWQDILGRLMESPGNFFFGLGYGFPLIDFVGLQGQVVREPHNSYMSILGRIGFLGAIFFVWMHVHLIRTWFRFYHLCGRAGYRLGQERLYLFMVFFVLVWVYSLGEDAFEKPFFTIPYYFFWGVILHYRLHLKRMLASEEDIPQETTKEESVFHANPNSS